MRTNKKLQIYEEPPREIQVSTILSNVVKEILKFIFFIIILFLKSTGKVLLYAFLTVTRISR